MKPVKLIIQAMGPYRGEETIDFSVLGDKKFFLIHGPTGSGKTSILDAMTYSLYGSTSGDERSLEQMRSHWADAETESYVQFDFYIGEKLYRIRRRPNQVLNKKRGSGTRSVDTEATLWLINGEPAVIAAGASRVTKKIESLLGFSSEQFRQVIVLPQGKFRELLSAKAEGREEILKVLFSTERFTLIQNMIKERGASVRQRLDALRLERETVLKGEGVQDVDELNDLLESRGAEAGKIKAVLKRLMDDEKKRDTEYQKASLVEARFAEKDGALEAMRLLEAEKQEMDHLSETVSLCRRALSLADLYKSVLQERVRLTDLKAKLDLSRSEESKAAEKRNSAEEGYLKLPELEGGLKNLEQEIVRLESASGGYLELENIRKEMTPLDKINKDSSKKYASLTSKREELQAATRDLQKEIGGAEIAGASIPALQSSLERIVSAGKRIAALEKNRADASDLEKKIAALEREKKSAQVKLDKSAEARKEIEDRWIKGQASVMARDLRDGEPCPVCGSQHHPAAAVWSGEVPSLKDIERARRDEKESEENFRNIEKELVKNISELESLKNLDSSTDDIPEEYRNMQRDELIDIYNKEDAKLKSLKEIYSTIDSRKGKLTETESSLAVLTAEADAAAAELKNGEIALASLESRFDQIKKSLPEGIPDMKSHRERLNELKKKAADLSLCINESGKAYQGASEIYTAAKALLEKSERDYKEAEEIVNRRNSEFAGRLSAEKFSSEGEFTEALRRSGSVKEIEDRLDNYKSQIISAADRVNRASAEVKDLERPDLGILSEKRAALKTEIEETMGSLKTAEAHAERILKIIEQIGKLNLQLESEEKNYGIVQTLAETAKGNNKLRLTFQRYVLQSLFDDVLMIASNRLERMSRGRYRLISPGRLEDKRLSGGLDLEVFDGYTGYSRPVVTLSGGEAFLASLSLALGLADLVQQYSGGIYLDTVFIDEGFGSLDSETLDLAINSLVDLQSSGRLVGIISHVNELKERIDARLEVIPVPYGSTTRFVV